jgi:hypothetical protein
VVGHHQVDCVLNGWNTLSVKPFDVDLLVDPRNLGLKHSRLILLKKQSVLRLGGGGRLEAQAEEMINHWSEAALSPEYCSNFVFKGLPMSGLLAPVVRQLMTHSFDRLMFQVDWLKEQLSCRQIKGIVLPYDVGQIYRLLVALGNQLDIPTVVVQHGAFSRPHWDQDRRSAKYAMLWSEAARAAYLSLGEPSERLIVSGAPSADNLPSLPVTAGQDRKPSSDHPRVVVLTTWCNFGEAFSRRLAVEDFILDVMQTLERVGGWKDITVKIHPGQNLGYYKRVMGQYLKPNVRLVRTLSLADTLAGASMAVCDLTSAAFDSVALGIPTVVFSTYASIRDLGSNLILPPFNGSGCIPVVYTRGELEGWINRWKSDPSSTEIRAYQQDLQMCLGPIGSKNSLQAAIYIKDLLLGNEGV